MKRYTKPLRAAAAIILVIAAALFALSPGWYLTVRDRDTGQLYARYPMEERERFSVGFKHSVNLSPVIDVYEICDGRIYAEETVYYQFGAGVQTELNPGETLTYGEDGAMIVGNIHQDRTGVCYIVGTIYDHVLTVDGEEISLTGLCGRNAAIRFDYEWRII